MRKLTLMLNIGVLGCGRIGRMHAANLVAHPRTNLVAVYDIDEQAALNVSKKTGAKAHASAEAVFSDDDIDAVLVSTITETHADYIEQSIAAGLPVLCEKPVDLDIDRVNRCAERVRNSDTQIQIGFNRRFDPGHRAARDAMLAGQVGDLQQVIITSRDPEMPPRSYYENAGGLLRDMTIHDFDLARFMLADEPVEVFAFGDRLIDPDLMDELDDHDSAMILLRTSDGKQCHINNSRTAVYGYDQRVELLGSKGMVQSGNRKPHEMTMFSASATEVSQPYEFFFIQRYREAFMAEIDAFVSCIENGINPEVTLEDGRRALLLAEAAYLSIAQKRVVHISEVT